MDLAWAPQAPLQIDGWDSAQPPHSSARLSSVLQSEGFGEKTNVKKRFAKNNQLQIVHY